MGMRIHQTGHDVPAWKPLSSGDRLRDQAPGRIHPQVNRPVTIWQLHRAHSPRHSGIISPHGQAGLQVVHSDYWAAITPRPDLGWPRPASDDIYAAMDCLTGRTPIGAGLARRHLGSETNPAMIALAAGAEVILHNPRLLRAASRLFGGEVIPNTVAVNVTAPMPAGNIHVDVPSFRGADRDRYPMQLLQAMAASGLFEDWRVAEAGAVWWNYQGPGGAYAYWPDGLGGPMRSEHPPFINAALVADNNRMYHRIGPIGDPAVPPPALSAAARISHHAAARPKDQPAPSFTVPIETQAPGTPLRDHIP